MKAARRAVELLREEASPKAGSRRSRRWSPRGSLPKSPAGCSPYRESGPYERLKRAPCERAGRHAWLTDLITQIYVESRGIYGGRRVHAELTLGRGVAVGHGQVELLMQRAGLRGVTGRPKWKRNKPDSSRPTT